MNIKTHKLIKKSSKWCTEDGEEIELFPSNTHLMNGIYYANIKQLEDGINLVERLLCSQENFNNS